MSRAQEALLQGNPHVPNSNAMQHVAMLLVPLVPQMPAPQSARPPSPGPDLEASESGSEEQRRAIRQAQDAEYAQAEACDLRRRDHQPLDTGEERQVDTAPPSPVDIDLVRRARARRFASDPDDPQRGH